MVRRWTAVRIFHPRHSRFACVWPPAPPPLSWTACGQLARRPTSSGITGIASRLGSGRYCGRPEGASDTGSHDFDHEFRHRVRWLRSPRSDGNGGFGHRSRAHVPSGHFCCPAHRRRGRCAARQPLVPFALAGQCGCPPPVPRSTSARTRHRSPLMRLPRAFGKIKHRCLPTARHSRVWQARRCHLVNRSHRSH